MSESLLILYAMLDVLKNIELGSQTLKIADTITQVSGVRS